MPVRIGMSRPRKRDFQRISAIELESRRLRIRQFYADLKWNHKAKCSTTPKRQDMHSVSPNLDDVTLAGSEILKTGGGPSKF